ncbi:MAG: hypothetical protein GC164_12325 [Phycisphaera sp.]|nr:hypothetical protein [Phycisphaera sp.]
MVAWSGVVAVAMMGCSSTANRKFNRFLSDTFEPFTPTSVEQAEQNALDPHDPDARRKAVATLSAESDGGNERYLAIYRQLVNDDDETVRAAAIRALGLYGQVSDVELILPHLTEDQPNARWESAVALQRIHSDTAIDPLTQTLQNDDRSDVRQAAAIALGQYPQPAAYNALVSALIDTDFGVVRAARQSLELLTGQDLGYDPSDWVKWSDAHRGHWFDKQQPYVWYPYRSPPGLIDKAQFWKDRDTQAKGITPRGLDAQPTPPAPPAPGQS